MTEALRNIIARNRAGRRVAIVSVCSAQPDVLRASIAMAQRLDRQVVIEATSNQVNQDGGYTGITPSEFIEYVHGLADDVAADRERIIFGGDHLGTQAWRRMYAKAAMAKACEARLRPVMARETAMRCHTILKSPSRLAARNTRPAVFEERTISSN